MKSIHLIFLCQGLFTFHGQPCSKWVTTDDKQFKVIYTLKGELHSPSDRIDVPDSVWSAAKDTVLPGLSKENIQQITDALNQ